MLFVARGKVDMFHLEKRDSYMQRSRMVTDTI
jgi:hypothetical protein